MSDLKFGEKVKLTGLELELEVRGILPQGQPLQLNYSDDRTYSVLINGKQQHLKESIIDLLVSLSKPVEETEEKRRPGRPKGE